jgi:hypothetical protein
MKTKVDQDKLTKMWRRYNSDPSIFTKESFGKYMHTRIMTPGWCWPSLYYARNGTAYDMVWRNIHRKDEEGIRRTS